VRALVTGAAGFIGSHVVRDLLAGGHAVRALHLPGEDLRNLAGLDVERLPGDVTDGPAMRAAARGCDWVFHLAAIYALWLPDPRRLRTVNVEGTRRVLEAAGEAGARVVYTSSIARFGGQGLDHRADEQSPFALGPTGDAYAASKAEAHEVAVGFAKAGLHVVLCAPTGPIGPGDVGPTPTGRLLLSAVTLPAVILTASASNFGDVRDIARGHVLAAERGRSGESYLLGNEDATLPELARIALRITGARKPILVAPFAAARLAARAALAYTERVSRRAPLFTPAAVAISALGLRARCDKAVRELGLPQRPLADSIRDALKWWAREGYLGESRLAARLAS
jgi:dihydroflavonol-4-reductase